MCVGVCVGVSVRVAVLVLLTCVRVVVVVVLLLLTSVITCGTTMMCHVLLCVHDVPSLCVCPCVCGWVCPCGDGGATGLSDRVCVRVAVVVVLTCVRVA